MGLNKLRTFSVALGLQNLDTPSLRGSTVNIRNETGDRELCTELVIRNKSDSDSTSDNRDAMQWHTMT